MTMQTSDGAELTVVNDEDARAAAIRDRRVRLGIRSQSAAEAESKRLGHAISRDAIMAAEKGTASDATYARLSAFYDAFEEEIGQDDGATEGHMVTFTISGNFGVTATVQGPIADFTELKEAAKELMREAMREGGETTD